MNIAEVSGGKDKTRGDASPARGDTPTHQTSPRRGYFDVVMVLFVSFLLLSNIGATKLVGLGDLIVDGGAILFPLTYILGDVLAEVYGFTSARRAIFMGFIISALASLVFWAVAALPPAAEYTNQAAFEAVLGVVPRFFIASLAGYIVGQLLNAWVLTRIKDRWGDRHLWARLIGSSIVGEAADTTIFCVTAWVGVVSWGTIVNLTVVGFLWKVAVEIVLLPVTYAVIGVVKKHESAS
ncbi:MAG: queuosine precursor transporter [Actinomycetaceae bacterium]|nr:queuosine precursor transporter [Actinomycetaceae bacterium]